MFRFGLNEALYAYLLVPVLCLLAWYAARARRRTLARFGDLDLVARLSASVNRRGRAVRIGLLLTAVAFAVTALARPQYGTRVETVRRQGIDVMIALDLSNSMWAEDVVPNRLQRARLAISRLIDRLDGDRIGLVAFAGDAFVQSPLTVDYAAARLFLNAMEPRLMPVQGTNLGAALTVALDALDETSSGARAIVVLTDGEDHEGEVAEAVQRAIEMDVTIHTAAVGSPDGVPIPDIDEAGRRRGFRRDADGNVVTSRVDQGLLRSVAQDTGGRFVAASTDGSNLDELADALIGEQGREFDAREVTQFEEQFQLFLGVALVLLIVEALVPDYRRRRTEWKGRFA